MNVTSTIKRLRILADKLERGEFELRGDRIHCDVRRGRYTGRFQMVFDLYDPQKGTPGAEQMPLELS